MKFSMIHPKTNIQILDVVKSGDGSSTIPIEKLFRYYYHNSKIDEGGIRYIDFITPINVTEQFNWTRIVKLIKIAGNCKWKRVNIENTHIYLNDFSLVPVYDIDEAYTGFHGEVKYPYKVKNISDLVSGDNIRLRRGKNSKGEEIEFGTSISIEDDEITTEYAYGLETMSGFFTGNNIHLIASIKSE